MMSERKSTFEPFFAGKDFEKIEKRWGQEWDFFQKSFRTPQSKIISQNHPRGTLMEIHFPKTVRERKGNINMEDEKELNNKGLRSSGYYGIQLPVEKAMEYIGL